WRYYDENGRLIIDGRFVHGEREGLWRRFYRASEAALLDTEPYKSFARPLISAATFHSGRMQGKWTVTDSKQRTVHEIELARGERSGAATWYYPSGAVMIAANYERGLMHGDTTRLAPDGTATEIESYEHGRKIFKKSEYYDDAPQAKKRETTY